MNDASTDKTARVIKQFFPKVKLITLRKNRGKAGAIKAGLTKIKTPYVLLLDADLLHFKRQEINRALRVFNRHSKIAMLILRRINSVFSTRLFRADILFSGERILKVADLRQILQKDIKGFQLEAAINYYFLNNQKPVGWVPFSAISTFKIYKRGFLRGLVNELAAHREILSYHGPLFFLKQYSYAAKIKRLN